MIELVRKGSKLTVKAFCSQNGYSYPFTYECGAGREDYAILLQDALAKNLWDVMKNVRMEAYKKGWKDAKKTGRKETWFWGGFK